MYYLCNTNYFVLPLRCRLVLMVCLFCGIASSQRIINYHLFTANSTVAVKFTIAKGISCGGYKILHSLDSVNFQVLEDYAGICGYADDDPRSFVHQSPTLNQVNYYKVELSNTEVSPTRRVFVASKPSAAIEVFPNPVNTPLQSIGLKIGAGNNTPLTGILYHPSGQPIRFYNLTGAEIMYADISGLYNGLYLIRLWDGERSYLSRFIIHR